MKSTKLLLCKDMDSTVIQNGAQAEPKPARSLFSAFCQDDDVTLAYVTGRDLALAQEAIKHYSLPSPLFFITDVGTNIYHKQECEWSKLNIWHD